MADETGVVATDKATFDYISSRKENLKEFRGEIPEHKDIIRYMASQNQPSTPLFDTPMGKLLPSKDYSLESWARGEIRLHAEGYPTNVPLTKEEENLFNKLGVYNTKTYGMNGAKANKAFEQLTPDERKILNGVGIRKWSKEIIENVGHSYRFEKLSWSDPNYDKKAEGIYKGIEEMVNLMPKYPIKDNESLNEYKVRLYNSPEAKQIFSNVPNVVDKTKIVALASVSTEENRDVVTRYSESWDKVNHKFKGWVNGVYRIVPQKEVTDRYNESKGKYGNAQGGFYHGTQELVARKISANGFIIPKTAKAGRMLGDGVYLAQNSSKSMQYIGSDVTRRAGTRGVMFELEAAMDSKVD